MLNRVSELQKKLSTLDQELKADQKAHSSAYDRMLDASEKLQLMQALDVKEVTDVTSPHNIEVIKARGESQAREIAESKDYQSVVTQYDLHAKRIQVLISCTDELINDIPVALIDSAELLDNFKKDLIQAIKQTIKSYHAYKAQLAEDAVAKKIGKSRSPDGLIKRNSPEADEISHLLQSPLALVKEKVARVNEKIKVNLACDLKDAQLQFNDALDELSLVQLMTYANEIMWATWSNKLYAQHFQELAQKYSKLLNCEWRYSLSGGADGGFYSLKMDETAETSFNETYNRYEIAAGKYQAEKNGLENVAAVVARQRLRFEEAEEALLQEAQEQVQKSIKFLEDLEQKAGVAAQSFKKLAEQSTALQQLLDESVEDDLSKIAEKKRLIVQQCQNLKDLEKSAVREVKFARVFNNQDIDPSPRYEDIKSAFEQAKQGYQQVFDDTSNGERNAAAYLAKLDKQAERIRREDEEREQKLAREQAASDQLELACQQELDESKDLQNSLKPLWDNLQAVSSICKEMEKEQASLTRLSSEMATISARANDETSVQQLKNLFAEVEKKAEEYQQLKIKFDKKRVSSSQLLKEFETQCNSLSPAEMKTKNHEKLVGSQKEVIMRFAQCSRVENNYNPFHGLTQKMEAKQAQQAARQAALIDQLIAVLLVVLAKENIKTFWHKKISYMGMLNGYCDGARVEVDGTHYSVPRGIYKARMALDELSKPDANKVQIAETACKAMKERFEKGSHRRKCATEVLYDRIVGLFTGEDSSKLSFTEVDLNELKTSLMQDPYFHGLKGIEIFQPTTVPYNKVNGE